MNAQDNKQLVMEGYQLFKDKDMKGLLALFSDDIEWIQPESDVIPFAHTYQGKDQVAQFFTEMDKAQESIQFEPETFMAESDKVVVTGTSTWLVKATGQEYDSPWVHVFTLRNGKVTRHQQYSNTAAAEIAFKPMPAPSHSKQKPLRH